MAHHSGSFEVTSSVDVYWIISLGVGWSSRLPYMLVELTSDMGKAINFQILTEWVANLHEVSEKPYVPYTWSSDAALARDSTVGFGRLGASGLGSQLAAL